MAMHRPLVGCLSWLLLVSLHPTKASAEERADCPPNPCPTPAPAAPPPAEVSFNALMCKNGAPWPCVPDPTEPRYFYYGPGLGVSLGFGPDVSLEARMAVGIKIDFIALEIAPHQNMGRWSTPKGKTSFDWSTQGSQMAACLRHRGFLGCGMVDVGWFEADGWQAEMPHSTIVYPSRNDDWYVGAGGRVAYDVPLFWAFFARAQVDAQKTVMPVFIHGGGDPIWRSPGYAVSASLSMLWAFWKIR